MIQGRKNGQKTGGSCSSQRFDPRHFSWSNGRSMQRTSLPAVNDAHTPPLSSKRKSKQRETKNSVFSNSPTERRPAETGTIGRGERSGPRNRNTSQEPLPPSRHQVLGRKGMSKREKASSVPENDPLSSAMGPAAESHRRGRRPTQTRNVSNVAFSKTSNTSRTANIASPACPMSIWPVPSLVGLSASPIRSISVDHSEFATPDRRPERSHGLLRHAAVSSTTTSTYPSTRLNVSPHPLLPMPIPLFAFSQRVQYRPYKMLSSKFKVFVIDMLDAQECDHILNIVADYEATLGPCERGDGRGFRALYTYTKQDLPCREVPGLIDIIAPVFRSVTHVIGHVIKSPHASSRLRPRSSSDPHLLKYRAMPGNEDDHTGCCMHYDGSNFTFSLMLSDPTEYVGGGTYFRCLRTTYKLRKGQILVHPGDLFHKGIDITSGRRDLVVCFVDGIDPKIDDPSSARSDKQKYQQHVVYT